MKKRQARTGEERPGTARRGRVRRAWRSKDWQGPARKGVARRGGHGLVRCGVAGLGVDLTRSAGTKGGKEGGT
jgi:hypothetical protein